MILKFWFERDNRHLTPNLGRDSKRSAKMLRFASLAQRQRIAGAR